MSNQEQERIKLVNRLSAIADQRFMAETREILAHFDLPAVQRSMSAYIRLNFRQEVQAKVPSVELYLELLQTTFLVLLDRGAVAPIVPLTKIAERDLELLRRKIGIGAETLEPEPTPLTDEQKREIQVRADWKALSADQIRKKKNDRLYRATFERIAATLDSQCTLHSIIGG